MTRAVLRTLKQAHVCPSFRRVLTSRDFAPRNIIGGHTRIGSESQCSLVGVSDRLSRETRLLHSEITRLWLAGYLRRSGSPGEAARDSRAASSLRSRAETARAAAVPALLAR